MRATRSNPWMLSIFVFAIAGLLAAVADADAPNVTGNGASLAKLTPQVVRMQMLVSAQGKDLKEALANLKEMELAAGQKLTTMGAAQSAVHWGDATPESASDRQRQMDRPHRGKQPAAGAAEPVKISVTLKVDWPVTGQNNEELLVAANDFQTKIKEAALAAPKTAAAAEEAEEEDFSSSNGEPPPGTPFFLYVHKVTDDERAKATADAFAKAKEDAARLAKAAGAELGPLQSLSDQIGNGAEGEAMYGGGPYQQWMFAAMAQQRMSGPAVDEVVSAQAGDVSLQVSVVATFALMR